MSDDNKSFTPKDSHYARLRREHRDRVRGEEQGQERIRGEAGGAKASGAKRGQAGQAGQAEIVRLYGLHTVAAALRNPERKLHRLLASRNALNRLEIESAEMPCPLEMVEPRLLDRELGEDAVHQGVMLEADPLPVRSPKDMEASPLILVLDQVTDPHNVGAILRSAAAFGVGAVVTTSRHSPQESGVLAKSASGALEHVPYVQIGNLADALGELVKLGYRTIGLDSEGGEPLETALSGDRIALVLGSEGKGLRQKTRETVDVLARLELPGAIRSLNVSNAAAVALYAARRHLA